MLKLPVGAKNSKFRERAIAAQTYTLIGKKTAIAKGIKM
jgi:hypothetical protein